MASVVIWLKVLFTQLPPFLFLLLLYSELSPNRQNGTINLLKHLRYSISIHPGRNDFKKVFSFCFLTTLLSLRIADLPREAWLSEFALFVWTINLATMTNVISHWVLRFKRGLSPNELLERDQLSDFTGWYSLLRKDGFCMLVEQSLHFLK